MPKRDGHWFFCPACSHRMFLVVKDGDTEIEIKCPSCKAIISFPIKEDKPDEEGT